MCNEHQHSCLNDLKGGGVIDKMFTLVMSTNTAWNPFSSSCHYVDMYEVDIQNVGGLGWSTTIWSTILEARTL